MSISSDLNKQVYIGNGVTTIFPFDFDVAAQEDLHIYLTDIAAGTSTEIVTNLTFMPANGSFPTSGGAIKYPTVGTTLTSAYSVAILRKLAITQPAVYPNNTALKPKVVEKSLDRLTMIAQQIQESTDRSFKLGVASNNVSGDLPAPIADDLLGWNADGTALVNITNKVARGIDGGNARSVYTDDQIYDGGGANG